MLHDEQHLKTALAVQELMPLPQNTNADVTTIGPGLDPLGEDQSTLTAPTNQPAQPAYANGDQDLVGRYNNNTNKDHNTSNGGANSYNTNGGGNSYSNNAFNDNNGSSYRQPPSNGVADPYRRSTGADEDDIMASQNGLIGPDGHDGHRNNSSSAYV